jgi:hypothetical protein
VHPDDVAEVVEEEAAELRAWLAAAPELRAGPMTLIDRFELRVPFAKSEYDRPHVLELVHPARRVLFNLGPRVERELILRCECSGYDAQPITAELLGPDGTPLPGAAWPKEVGAGGLNALTVLSDRPPPRVTQLLAPGPQAIIHEHQDYDRPFFCRRGLREFHSHPQHEDNPWDRHRESIRIYDIVPELLADLQTRWMLLL